MRMLKFAASELEQLTNDIFLAIGASAEEASAVAQHLVDANLSGHDSHGVLRIPQYVGQIRDGKVRLGARVTVVHETVSGIRVDGGQGFGQIVAREAMKLAIERARKTGISCASVFRSAHIGRLASYTQLAANENMIGLLAGNSGGAGQLVAPFGGIAPRLATNPISIAVPMRGSSPLVLDIATSVAPEGKLRAYRQRGDNVPEGWILDPQGKPSTNPNDFYGPPLGALLPLGGMAGHKGYGLSFMIDILAGALSGAGCSRPNAQPDGDGLFVLAIDIQQFTPLDEFQQRVTDLVNHVKTSPSTRGSLTVEVPGDFEKRETHRRRHEGISVDERTWREIVGIARELDVRSELLGRSWQSDRNPTSL